MPVNRIDTSFSSQMPGTKVAGRLPTRLLYKATEAGSMIFKGDDLRRFFPLWTEVSMQLYILGSIVYSLGAIKVDKVLASPVSLLPVSWYDLLKARRENLADAVWMVPSFSRFQQLPESCLG